MKEKKELREEPSSSKMLSKNQKTSKKKSVLLKEMQFKHIKHAYKVLSEENLENCSANKNTQYMQSG